MRWRPWALVLGLTVLLLAVAACEQEPDATAPPTEAELDADSSVAVVHRGPLCACCEAHADYLAEAGFEVREEVHEDLPAWKTAREIPDAARSCHTTVVGDYLVEGHIPAETIARLLGERPEADGIALPGMPAGSPGMGGVKDEPWVIELFADGAVTDVFEVR